MRRGQTAVYGTARRCLIWPCTFIHDHMCAFVMADIVYLCGLVLAVLYWGWRGGNFACMHAKRMYIYEKASFLLGGAEPADALVVECVIGPRLL